MRDNYLDQTILRETETLVERVLKESKGDGDSDAVRLLMIVVHPPTVRSFWLGISNK